MEFVFNDGGRKAAGYLGETGDCVTRAIAIATGMPYQEAYDLVNEVSREEKVKFGRKKSSARTGVHKKTTREIMASIGWTWHPTMLVGRGCTVHLRSDELPSGRLVVSVSKHLCAVIDGVLHDTHDCSRDGSRCVYGYFKKG